MTNKGGYRDGRANAAVSRRGPARQIGWGAASRLVDGKHGGPGTEDLGTLLAIAAAPAREMTADPARLEPVLAAYRRAGADQAAAHRSAARPALSRSALAKCAAVLLVFGGSSVAAASAGVLPASVQRIAHDYLGGVGIPAPSSHGPAVSSPSETPSAVGSPSATIGRGDASEGGAAQITTLCQKVAASTHGWRAGLDAADQAALVTAAAGSGNVKQYCVTLLTQSGSGASGGGQSAAPSPSASPSPSPTASPEATDTHGGGHVNHSPSPNPHSTGH